MDETGLAKISKASEGEEWIGKLNAPKTSTFIRVPILNLQGLFSR
jgi:hypothetical protein